MNNNTFGQVMSSTEWLENHFIAKSPQLLKNVAKLPIQEGDQVLDLCCGPGLYMQYLINLVGASGRVVGVDHDPLLLSAANKRLSLNTIGNWDLINSDMLNYSSHYKNFDIIILFNALAYSSSYVATIDNILQSMTPGSLLIIKDFDMRSTSYNPICKRFHGELIDCITDRQEVDNRPQYINKFVGCNLHTLSNIFVNNFKYSFIWSYLFKHPFSLYQKQYFAGVFQNSIDRVLGYCSNEVISYFSEMFCNENGKFYSHVSSTIIENEHLVVLSA